MEASATQEVVQGVAPTLMPPAAGAAAGAAVGLPAEHPSRLGPADDDPGDRVGRVDGLQAGQAVSRQATCPSLQADLRAQVRPAADLPAFLILGADEGYSSDGSWPYCSEDEFAWDLPGLLDDAADSDDEDPSSRLPHPSRLQRQPSSQHGAEPTEPHPNLDDWADSPIVMAAQHEELEPVDPPAVALDPEERLYGIKFGDQLTPTQIAEMKAVLRKHSGVFSWHKYDLGRTHLVELEIDTGDSPPVASRPYRMSRREQELERLEVQRMLRAGIIEPSDSPWASPLCMVPKKSADGKITGMCLTVDLRKVNQVVRRPQMPMPRIDDMLDKLSGSCYWSKCDLNSSFWQLPLAPKDREKYCRLHFGWAGAVPIHCNAPGAHLQPCLLPATDECSIGGAQQRHGLHG